MTQGNLIGVDFIGSNISVGWNVLGGPFLMLMLAEPTVVTSKTQNSNGTGTLTLSKNIISHISGFSVPATNLNDDRSLCCPPTDTAPPFTATARRVDYPFKSKERNS